MRQNSVLVLCWLAIIGNLLMMPGVSAAAACDPDFRCVAIPAFIVEILSVLCGFVLRGRVISAMRAARPGESGPGKGGSETEGAKGSTGKERN